MNELPDRRPDTAVLVHHDDFTTELFADSFRNLAKEDAPAGPSLTDFMGLAGGAEVVEFTVSEDAEVAGLTIEDAVSEGLLADEMLVVGIEREGEVITPKGETDIQAGDVISLFSKDPLETDTLEVFGAQ